MTSTVNIHEAKTHLSRLLVRVADGDEVVIAKNGVPLARLVQVADPRARTPGRFRGQIHGVESLIEPSQPDDQALWAEGHAADPLTSLFPSRA
ncbi:MAG: type II toxin-antitoxin system prevent-host-death family antitoxin [Verrucomicrobiaceae bacterium]|nr:type II toxin-antitoxin system prevent-host-death family antitoxin [Verrucomicrobiaceae bacterium]